MDNLHFPKDGDSMDKDYSEYQFTEYEKYRMLRSNRKDITIDYFDNKVRFYPDERRFQIRVDGSNEYYRVNHFLKKYEEEEQKRLGIPHRKETEKEEEENKKFRASQETENKMLMAQMKEKYRVNFNEGVSEHEEYYVDHPTLPVEPFINIFSSAQIDLYYGEGILDFIYADFVTASKPMLQLFYSLEKIGEEMGFQTGKKKEHIPEKIYSRAQSIANDFYKYSVSFVTVKEIAYSSLYSAICPPIFKGNYDTGKVLLWYVNYLIAMQKEYLELIKFCFDEAYYPSVLGHLHPAERFSLYRYHHDLPGMSRRTERVSFSFDSAYKENMPYGMPFEKIKWRLQNPPAVNDEIRALAKELGALPEELAADLAIPRFMHIQYEFGSVAEILELEFTKMLEANIRFRKCKRCGKYFIMKGNYDTNYCDRVAPGETRNCQELAAAENYKSKIADNKAIPVYNKYYKRYAARVKVRQIKEADFKKWKYQALTMRDECSDGKITVEEYIQWMEDSFPNRKHKSEK